MGQRTIPMCLILRGSVNPPVPTDRDRVVLSLFCAVPTSEGEFMPAPVGVYGRWSKPWNNCAVQLQRGTCVLCAAQ